MLSKKPVIAANHGGLVEIVKDHETGLLFEANNAKDLAEKISFLLEKPELIKIYGENGFKRVNENFSTKKYINSFEEEYEKLTK
jgi:glycosyltransferase involved in cell wall biosynthesis